MIPAEYYQYVYLFIIAIMTMIYVSPYNSSSRPVKKKNEEAAFLFTVFIILFIGFRPISAYFGDMPGYSAAMNDHRFEYEPVTWDRNFIFVPMMAFLSSHGATPQTPIVILAAINFLGSFFAIRKIFPKDVFLGLLVSLGAFTTFGGAVNGLKAGCAASLFLVALAYREKKLVSILFLILSMGFHHSMQLSIAAYFVCLFYKNTKVIMYFWLLCLLLSMAHVTAFMGAFAGWTDDHGAEYLLIEAGSAESEFSGRLGFRYDFVIYSVIPLILGYYTLFKKKLASKEYQFILNFYILTNSIWLLCMYANFTNRIASLSWLVYPLLILYPFMNLEWGVKANKHLYFAVCCHLGFTLFMTFIYYVL